MTAPHSDASAIQAIADPLQTALHFRAITMTGGSLNADEQREYRKAIAALRGDGERKQIWIARKLQLSRQRVGQLLGAKTHASEGAAA